MQGGANLPLVSNYNRGVVLDAIRAAGTVSRVELSTMTGLTAPTVSNIVRRLMADDLVVEAGQVPSSGGKPRTLLRLNPQACFAVGVQLGYEAITYVITDLGGTTVARSRRAGAGRRSPDAVIARIATEVHDLIDASSLELRRVVGLGVASPGPLDHANGVILAPPSLGHWDAVPLRDELQRASGLAVTVDNDANAAAIGERWLGSAGSARTFACIYMGTGIGAGVFLDGHVHRGASSNAGEIGHISLDPDGEPCVCGNRGCVELVSAPTAVVAAARAHDARHPKQRIGLPAVQRSVVADFAKVGRAALDGHRFAGELMQRSATYLANAVLALVNVLDLELVVLAGNGFETAGPLYVDAITETLGSTAFARRTHQVTVRLSPISNDVAAVGAATLVLHGEFTPQLLGLGPT